MTISVGQANIIKSREIPEDNCVRSTTKSKQDGSQRIDDDGNKLDGSHWRKTARVCDHTTANVH